jgi:ABC-2 type transport system permease protein
MAIFAIFAATRLVAHMAENGSLAYLLATPVPRRRIAATAAAVLLTEVVAIGLVTALGGLLGAALFVRDAALNAVWFLELNLVGTLLFCVVAGYAFVLSCLAPDERSALSLSALLTLVLYALHLAADLTARLAWLGHLSLFSVLDSQALIEGRGPVGADVAGLAFATVLLVAAGVLGFGRRQFSL